MNPFLAMDHTWRVSMTDLTPSPLVAAGSLLAMLGGGTATLIAQVQKDPGPTATVGIVVGIGGVVAGFVGGLAPIYRSWVDHRKASMAEETERRRIQAEADRRAEEAKWERHDLANRLQVATLQIEAQKEQIRENAEALAHHRQTIARLLNHSPTDPPVPPMDPDPAMLPKGPDYSS